MAAEPRRSAALRPLSPMPGGWAIEHTPMMPDTWISVRATDGTATYQIAEQPARCQTAQPAPPDPREDRVRRYAAAGPDPRSEWTHSRTCQPDWGFVAQGERLAKTITSRYDIMHIDG